MKNLPARGTFRPYFTPCISRTVGLIRMASTTAAAMLKTATDPNRLGTGMELYIDAAFPASQLPMLVERNQIPMMNPPARAGASLVMALNPTGLRHNSPSVCSRYVPTSQYGPTLQPPTTPGLSHTPPSVGSRYVPKSQYGPTFEPPTTR